MDRLMTGNMPLPSIVVISVVVAVAALLDGLLAAAIGYDAPTRRLGFPLPRGWSGLVVCLLWAVVTGLVVYFCVSLLGPGRLLHGSAARIVFFSSMLGSLAVMCFLHLIVSLTRYPRVNMGFLGFLACFLYTTYWVHALR